MDGLKRVVLREFAEKDIYNKIKWINNSENNEFLHYHIPLEYDKTLNWFKSKNNSVRKDLVILYDDIPVGLIGLLNINVNDKKAEFYISMGETQYKNKGIATEACKQLISYAFDDLNLHKLYLNTDAKNKIAHKLFEKVGFQREGYFIDDMIHRGKFIDRIRYGIINKSGDNK